MIKFDLVLCPNEVECLSSCFSKLWPKQDKARVDRLASRARECERINMHKRSIGEIKLLHRGHADTQTDTMQNYVHINYKLVRYISLARCRLPPSLPLTAIATALIPLLSFPFRCKSHGGNECFAHDLLLNSRARGGEGKGKGASGVEGERACIKVKNSHDF